MQPAELDLLTTAALALGFTMILLNILAGISCVVFFFTITTISDYFKLARLEFKVDESYYVPVHREHVHLDIELRHRKTKEISSVRLKGNFDRWEKLSDIERLEVIELWVKKNHPGWKYYHYVSIMFTDPLKKGMATK